MFTWPTLKSRRKNRQRAKRKRIAKNRIKYLPKSLAS